MLNSETKRKIDSARNILVGNVTNPISQVDQITNALIYKFMDDMDQENLEVDLKPQFFVGDYAKYSWTKLLDKKLSGQERMNLYIQATESMSKNPHIPQLFRDIFKGAFLPYNDPRVLTLFLKEIDGFSYSHSEELGNAFEYLLSILGSQGDAGQFRTPRHIIDFIAEVVDPKKNETILDPACGTAGFLISTYKHILKAHDGLDNKTGKPTNKEKNLTPDEKAKLMNNIVGYDISPDMVKLSLVNMYLHGFQNPKIYKYDTLSSEKRWDEQFDVIMANPPFMTPKGGIKPHKRFSIQANRAEVLFVDYIMEHLSIRGRAGIIIPEGVIFKGDKAYKMLRKKLVEDGLFAVVSLPAGVFQPYSGVKTSILFFDNQIAKQTDEMLFLKIENDGFDLGAQRRKIDKNDLPRALKLIQKYKESLNNKDVCLTGRDVRENNILLVSKNEIIESGNYNLTIDKYRKDPLEYLQNIINIKDIEKSLQPAIDSVNNFVKSSAFLQLQENLKKMTEQYQNLLENNQIKQIIALQKKFSEELKKQQKWEMVELVEVAEVNAGNSAPQDKKLFENGKYPFCRTSDVGRVHISKSFKDINDYLNDNGIKKLKLFKKDTILFPKSGASTFLNHRVMLVIDSYVSSHLATIFANKNKIIPDFLFYLLKTVDAKDLTNNQNYPSLKLSDIKKIKIPLPPLEVQKEIVEQIKGYQEIIDGAKQVVDNWEPDIAYSNAKMVKVGEVVDFVSGVTLAIGDCLDDNGIPIITIADVAEDGNLKLEKIRKVKTAKKVNILEKGDLLFNWRNGSKNLVGKTAYFDLEGKYIFASFLLGIRSKKKLVESKFLWFLLNKYRAEGKYMNFMRQNVNGLFNREELKDVKIPLPPLATQKQLVAEVEKEEEIITANKKLIEIMERKIEKVIAKI